jgi:CBS-domain-containing membrane protein
VDAFYPDRLDIHQMPQGHAKAEPLISVKGYGRRCPIVKPPFSLQEAAMEFLHQQSVQDNMSRPARTVAPEMTLGDLLRLFSLNDFDAYPVVREERLVGIVSRADSIKPFAAKVATKTLDPNAIVGTTVEQIMSSRVVTVELDATLERVVEVMGAHDFESFPVVDRENRVNGMIARDDVVRALARSTWHTSLPLDLRPSGYAIA